MHVNIQTERTKRTIQIKKKTYLEKTILPSVTLLCLQSWISCCYVHSVPLLCWFVQTVSVKVCVCLMDEQHTIHFSSISTKGCCKASWGLWAVSPHEEADDINSSEKRWRKKQILLAQLGCIFLSLPVNSFLLGFPEIRGKHMTAGLVRRHTDVCAKEWGRGKFMSVLLHRLLLQRISQRGRHRDAEWHALVQSCHWSASCGQWESGSASHWSATSTHSSLILIQLQERLPGNRICLWEQSTIREETWGIAMVT